MLDNENNDELLDSLEETTEVKDELIETTDIVVETKVEKLAEELGLEIKLEEVKEDNNAIKSKPRKAPVKASLSSDNSGVISTFTPQPLEKPVTTTKTKEEEKVALFSTKNVNWVGVGKVSRGYNIVTKTAADKWLTRDHVRIVSPDEIAKEFGN